MHTLCMIAHNIILIIKYTSIAFFSIHTQHACACPIGSLSSSSNHISHRRIYVCSDNEEAWAGPRAIPETAIRRWPRHVSVKHVLRVYVFIYFFFFSFFFFFSVSKCVLFFLWLTHYVCIFLPTLWEKIHNFCLFSRKTYKKVIALTLFTFFLLFLVNWASSHIRCCA